MTTTWRAKLFTGNNNVQLILKCCPGVKILDQNIHLDIYLPLGNEPGKSLCKSLDHVDETIRATANAGGSVGTGLGSLMELTTCPVLLTALVLLSPQSRSGGSINRT